MVFAALQTPFSTLLVSLPNPINRALPTST
jgi:hypothetical protein